MMTMPSPPDISIVMPCYQQREFLEEAVRSVLDQQEVHVELIVMDPGSTDGSRELLLKLQREFTDRLILHFAPDSGQSDAINRGMSRARGNVLGWLNSDDRLKPGALSLAVANLDAPEPRWMYGRGGIVNAKGHPISRPIVWYKNWRGRRFSIYKLITEDFIPQMSTFWNRSIWESAGGVDPRRHLDMDYDLFIRFAMAVQPIVTDRYLADFRVHHLTKSSQQTDKHLDAAMDTARKYSRELGVRGRVAFLLHRIYSARTRVIYRIIKP